MQVIRNGKVEELKPGIYGDKEHGFFIITTPEIYKIFCEVIDRETRIENPASRNKPLAQGKPSGSRAKGKPAKGGKPPRKGAGKK